MNFEQGRQMLAERGRACMRFLRQDGVIYVKCLHCGAELRTLDDAEAGERVRRHVEELCAVTAPHHAKEAAP